MVSLHKKNTGASAPVQMFMGLWWQPVQTEYKKDHLIKIICASAETGNSGTHG